MADFERPLKRRRIGEEESRVSTPAISDGEFISVQDTRVEVVPPERNCSLSGGVCETDCEGEEGTLSQRDQDDVCFGMVSLKQQSSDLAVK